MSHSTLTLKTVLGVFFSGCCAGTVLTLVVLSVTSEPTADSFAKSPTVAAALDRDRHLLSVVHDDVTDAVREEVAKLSSQISALNANGPVLSTEQLTAAIYEALRANHIDSIVPKEPIYASLETDYAEELHTVNIVVDAAIEGSEWGEEQRQAFYEAAKHLPTPQRVAAMKRVISALNQDLIQLEDGQPLFRR